jgi:Skp family chaperone for outer membrane proteins
MSKPDIKQINVYNVQILSIKNQLMKAKTIDELILLTNDIVNLETLILTEKKIGYDKLNQKKQKIENKINKLEKELQDSRDELDSIKGHIQLKLAEYRSAHKSHLQQNIDNAYLAYQSLTKKILDSEK